MIDVKITPDGDIDLAPGRGDVALTGYSTLVTDNDVARCVAQMARMALSTEKGDLLIAPALGHELNKLIGLPNKPATAALGERIIKSALMSWGLDNKVTVESWPKDPSTLAFEVSIELGPSSKQLTFTVTQALNTIE